MNNSKIAMDAVSLRLEEAPTNVENLREKETKNLKIITAIQEVQKLKGWSSLKEEVFDPLVGTLERELREEAKKEAPDTLKLNRLAGQLKWAEKFSDLNKLAQPFVIELTNIKKLLYGTKES